MKKVYAFFAAALMSVSLFAAPETVPAVSDLASVADLSSEVVLCLYFDEQVCNDIVLVGTYNGWNTEDPESLTKFEKLTGFSGWYYAACPFVEGETDGKPNTQAKAVQLTSDGKVDWKYQTGDQDAWIWKAGKTVTFTGGFDGEADVAYTEPGAYIYEIAYFKLHNSPCVAAQKYNYTIVLFDPWCEENPEFVPTIAGDFNSWTHVEMNASSYEGEEAWILVVNAEPGEGFKFAEATAGGQNGWDNQFEYYDEEEDGWKQFGNQKLPATDKDMDVVFDWSDLEKYRYPKCGEEPEDPCDEETKHKVVVGVNAPAGVPEAGIEIIGYDGWDVGTVMERNVETGWYVAVLENILECSEFKLREAGSWDNEIVNAETGKGLDNIKFRNVWEDYDWKGEKCKLIELDYSAGYVWKANWSSVEDVVLTVKAQKVVVDGVMYIVRDNKLFNVQGAQIR